MKLIDRIMDALNLYDEEDILDEELELKKPLPKEEPPKERPSIFKPKNITASKPQEAAAPAREKKPLLSFKKPQAAAPQQEEGKMSSRTLNLPVANKLVSVVVLEPVSFDDSQKIADYLRSSKPVVVNFQNTDNVVAKRMTDFISGTIYALGGTLRKLGRNILVCAPKNVDIDAGEEMADEGGEQPWKK